MGILNLPQPGLATGILAKSWGNTIDQKREDEKEKTKMIGQALLQQAQSGTLDEKGFAALDTIDPALGSTARNMNKQASEQNAMKLQEMKMNKTLIGYKSANEKLSLMDKFEKVGDKESSKILADEINQYFKAVGIESNVSPLMEAAVRKAQVEKANIAELNMAMGAADKNPTKLTIKHANDLLMLSTKTIDPKLIPVIQKRIDVANSRLEKETERKENLETKKAEEGRKQQAEIAKEDRAATAPTPDIKEFQFARKEGYKGSFQKWQSEKKADKETGKGEVTWTTATNNLSKRFGSQDALGNIIITKELQDKHKLSQKKLVDLKKQGMDPLEAINTAEDYANQVESKYQEYMTAAKELKGKERKTAEDKIKAAYKKKYGYLPR